MSTLWISPENDPNSRQHVSALDDISRRLNDAHIRFERWTADRELKADATQDEILKIYDRSLQRIKSEIGFASADVISLHPALPNTDEIRRKFLNEHIHTEDEARFFVDGRGLFYIHFSPHVYILLCEKGDFINIPAGTKHWFDMGPQPLLKCIRTFNNPEGWVADFTGSDIASGFPRFEQLITQDHAVIS